MRSRNRRLRWGAALVAVALVGAACSSSDGGSASGRNAESVTVSPNLSAVPIVVNVMFTENGFEPETIFLPAGYPVRLVLRNRTEHEHHYRVDGLIASEVRWIVYPEIDLYDLDSLSDEELFALDPELATITDMAELEHVLHHLSPTYSPTKPASLSGIKPLAGEVHGYAQRGEADSLTFYPLTTGSYLVQDVLNPEVTGSVVVYLPEVTTAG